MKTFVLAACVALLAQSCEADDQPSLFTAEQMRESAGYIGRLQKRQKLDNSEQYLQAAEFRGYLWGVLDGAEQSDTKLTECARRIDSGVLLSRVAYIVSEVLPLNRSVRAHLTITMAILAACDEKTWTPKK